MPGQNHQDRTCRHGFTLLELMLVMVVLVIMASLALPSLGRILEGQKVDRGADLVRAALGDARVQAIRTGRVHAFVCQPGSSAMMVVPLDQLGSGAGNLSQIFSNDRELQRFSNHDFSARQLPQKVRFTSTVVIDNSRSEMAMEDASGMAGGSSQYVLFYPDGTSQDAQLGVANDRGFQKRIVVRGLTGTARISNVEAPR